MPDLVNGADVFPPAVPNAVPVIEKRWQKPGRDVAIPVDRRAQDRATVFAVIRRIVGAAAEE